MFMMIGRKQKLHYLQFNKHYYKYIPELVLAGNNFNSVTDGGRNMFGIESVLATMILDAAKTASQAAHGAAVVSKTAAQTSKGAADNVVRNATQNSVLDKIKSYVSFKNE